MDYRTHRSYHVSKVWILLTLFVFVIALALMQTMYHTAEIKPDFDIAFLTISYLVPIILCIISLTLSHFQKLKLGALIGILIGINLISNIALTDIITNSTEVIINLFEPIFSILPNLDKNIGTEQFNIILTIINCTQIIYGIFLIIIHIPVLITKDEFKHL